VDEDRANGLSVSEQGACPAPLASPWQRHPFLDQPTAQIAIVQPSIELLDRLAQRRV